ncbi:replication-associated protein [Crucivirus-392]|nr:replication-associated protein [Crucivirus-392]
MASKFRLNGKNLFLTYAQSGPIPATDFFEVFREKFGSLYNFSVVCYEDHHDNDGVHRHAFVQLNDRCNFKDPRCLDVLGKHGKYEVCKSAEGSLKYVLEAKAGEVKELFFDGVSDAAEALAKVVTKKRKSVWADLNERLLRGDSVQMVASELSMLHHLQRIEYAAAAVERWRIPVLPGFGVANTQLVTLYNCQIATWLNSNIGCDRVFKQKQLYVYGGTNIGKTTLMNRLCELVRVYVMPYDGNWLDSFDESYDVVVFDEFKANYTVQFLNRFIEGSVCPVSRRGIPPFMKKKNIPMIFLSNYSLSECYSKMSDVKLDTLMNRLHCVYADGNIRIDIKSKAEVIPSVETVEHTLLCTDETLDKLIDSDDFYKEGELSIDDQFFK